MTTSAKKTYTIKTKTPYNSRVEFRPGAGPSGLVVKISQGEWQSEIVNPTITNCVLRGRALVGKRIQSVSFMVSTTIIRKAKIMQQKYHKNNYKIRNRIMASRGLNANDEENLFTDANISVEEFQRYWGEQHRHTDPYQRYELSLADKQVQADYAIMEGF